ncbi:thiamine phosphate synthase [Maribacter sp. 2304DJ31-5]|uniref:thiamine phosphate synthase n=1 Tax=Maribacter sp. 2304DJ31-5 TaxID=3386273 RepID=UPI0039BC3299
MISKLQYITQGDTPEKHLEHINNACSAGAEWVQLRLKNMTEQVMLETATKAKEITSHYQTRLIINDHYKIAIAVKADGVHLGKKDTCPTIVKKTLASWQIIGGTANTLEDCQNLIKKGVNYIGLGPFKFTNTKKQLSTILGNDGYKTIMDKLNTNIPIIAIGGIEVADTKQLLDTGVYGIAVSGAITTNFNAISKFNNILKGPITNEQVWKVPNEK